MKLNLLRGIKYILSYRAEKIINHITFLWVSKHISALCCDMINVRTDSVESHEFLSKYFISPKDVRFSSKVTKIIMSREWGAIFCKANWMTLENVALWKQYWNQGIMRLKLKGFGGWEKWSNIKNIYLAKISGWSKKIIFLWVLISWKRVHYMYIYIEMILLLHCFFQIRAKVWLIIENMRKSKEYWYYWRWIKYWCRLCSISTSIFLPSNCSSPQLGHYRLNSWYNTERDVFDCLQFTEHKMDELVHTQFIIT
jgi:hypothetical protein